jgi:tRNA(Ile)-lysidine synthase
LKYLRNRVRWELLPLLRKYNPNVLGTVARAEETLRKANEHFKRISGEAFRRALICESSEEIVLNRRALSSHEELICEHLVREAIRRVKGDLQGIEAAHIEIALSELRRPRSGVQVTLPQGIRLIVQSDRVILTRNPPRGRCKPYCFELRIGGENRFEEIGWRFDLTLLEGSYPTPRDHLEARIDCATIIEPLYVRNRRRGDRFEPLGLGGTKKLQDFFVDERIPRERRDEIPLICDQQGILWVVGWRLSERCRVTPSTRQTLCIRAVPLKRAEVGI